jgi:hypothetical protein
MIIVNPGSLHRVAIAVYSKTSFYDQQTSRVPFLSFSKPEPKANEIAIPYIDVHDEIRNSNLKIFGADGNNYTFGLVNKLTINPISVSQPVNTNTYSNFIAQIKSDNYLSAGTLNIPVLITNQNYTSDLENFYNQIWKLGVFYFLPFYIYTDISPTNLGGPLFVTEYKISVSDNGPVEIDINFTGGLKYIPPDYIEPPVFQGEYRTARSYDCLVIPNTAQVQTGFYSTSQIQSGFSSSSPYVFFNNLASYLSSNSFYLQSASLSIVNKISNLFTANTTNGTQKITDGVKYISLSKRTVKGQISFLASTDLLLIYSDIGSLVQQLTLYFSGPFIFVMENVYINFFGSVVSGDGDSFIHTLDFEALISPTNFPEKLSYWQQTEFNIGIVTNGQI